METNDIRKKLEKRIRVLYKAVSELEELIVEKKDDDELIERYREMIDYNHERITELKYALALIPKDHVLIDLKELNMHKPFPKHFVIVPKKDLLTPCEEEKIIREIPWGQPKLIRRKLKALSVKGRR